MKSIKTRDVQEGRLLGFKELLRELGLNESHPRCPTRGKLLTSLIAGYSGFLAHISVYAWVLALK